MPRLEITSMAAASPASLRDDGSAVDALVDRLHFVRSPSQEASEFLDGLDSEDGGGTYRRPWRGDSDEEDDEESASRGMGSRTRSALRVFSSSSLQLEHRASVASLRRRGTLASLDEGSVTEMAPRRSQVDVMSPLTLGGDVVHVDSDSEGESDESEDEGMDEGPNVMSSSFVRSMNEYQLRRMVVNAKVHRGVIHDTLPAAAAAGSDSEAEPHPPVHVQVNLDHYTDANQRLRSTIKRSPIFRGLVEEFWRLVAAPPPGAHEGLDAPESLKLYHDSYCVMVKKVRA